MAVDMYIFSNFNKVYKMARYAYTNVSMYINIARELGINVDSLTDEELWEAIPYVEKARFVEEEMDCISYKYLSKLHQNKLLHYRTSGSTGMYMDIYWDDADWKRSMSTLWLYRKKYYSISPNDKMVYFYTFRGELDNGSEYVKNTFSLGISKLLLNEKRIQEVYLKIYNYSPKWMILQPSVALILCMAKEKYDLPKISSLEYIEMTGEYLSDEIRVLVMKTFGCNIANQYGCNEANSIAFECPYGNMHIMKDNVYIENIDGDIFLTTLLNNAMPFIKYGLGDKISIQTHENKDYLCMCGCKTPIIKVNNGRKNDLIILPNGEKVNCGYISREFEMLNVEFDGGIKQYNVRQYEYDKFEVTVVLEDNFKEKDVSIISKHLTKMFEINFGYSPYIYINVQDVLLPNKETGKLKCFESMIS